MIDDLKEIKIQSCLLKDEQSQLHQMPDLGFDHLLQSHVESELKTQSISDLSFGESATSSSYSFAALKRTRQFCCFGKCTSYRQSSLECSFMAPFVWHLDFSSPNVDDWRSNAPFPNLLPFPSLFAHDAFGQLLGGSNEKYLVTSQNKVDSCGAH